MWVGMIALAVVSVVLLGAWWWEARASQRLMATIIDALRDRQRILEEALDHYRAEGLRDQSVLQAHEAEPDLFVPTIPVEVETLLAGVEDADARNEFRELLLFRLSADPAADPMTAAMELFE